MSTRNPDLLALVVAASLLAAPAMAAEMPAPVAQFVKQHCADCHDAESREGGLDLTRLSADLSDGPAFDAWVKALDRVTAGEMPPAKAAQPAAAERAAMVKQLSSLLTAADTKRQATVGRVAMRRLTRTEYENTVRDLFAMPGLKVKDLLPEDGRFRGFDKSSNALEISAIHLRKYLEAADYILDAAIVHAPQPQVYRTRIRQIGGLAQFGESVFPIKEGRVDVEFIKQIKKLRLPERLPIIASMDSLGMLTSARPSFEPNVGAFAAFHAGYYRFKTSLWSFHVKLGVISETDRFQTCALTADDRVLGYLDAPPGKPREHELVVWLNAGDRLQLNPANLWPNYKWIPGYDGPAVAMDWFDIEGPLNETWPPASHRRLFGGLPLAELSNERDRPTPRIPPPPQRHSGARPNHQDGKEYQTRQPVWTAASPRPQEDAERLLKDFLPRAFRRPVAAEELAVYLSIAKEQLAAGQFFETAMRAAYRQALCAPDFLFLLELPRPETPDPLALDSYAQASRLSYFLWGSQPDDELLALAAKQPLGGKALQAQVDRMLADPRSDRFINDFLDQWLELREIDATSPDNRLYPEFRPDLRDAMLAESRAYFREMLRSNLGASHAIDSDFVMLNQRLAEHYGIAGVTGGEIRKLPRPEGSPRGGFLTQGAVLKVTANGTVTSPVLRGAWVLDRLLGQPPLPPPPDVAAIDPDLRGATTIREQLAQHRSNATCAACHAKIDPPGFALESFDAIGGWRTRYRHMGAEGDLPDPTAFLNAPANTKFEMFKLGQPVDSSGVTAEGESYRDVAEYKTILLAQEDALARNLLERLIHYATGAPVTFADRVHVEKILKTSRGDRYGLKTLVLQVVASPMFTHK